MAQRAHTRVTYVKSHNATYKVSIKISISFKSLFLSDLFLHAIRNSVYVFGSNRQHYV